MQILGSKQAERLILQPSVDVTSKAVRIAHGFERRQAFEQYRAIELMPQSITSPLSPWFIDDAKERAAREADTARAVFNALGNA